MSDQKKLEDLGAEALGLDLNDKEVEVKEEPTPELALETRAQKKARIAQVFTRGVVNSKLQAVYEVAVPEDRVGKFIRDTEEDIIRYRNLGFEFVYKKGAATRVDAHGTADGRIRIGDVVLVTISKEDHGILKELKHEQVLKKLDYGKEEFMTLSGKEAESGGAVPFDESQRVIGQTNERL